MTDAKADSTTPLVEVSELSFEQARDELVQIVSQLEQGAPTLEQSLQLWSRGEELADRCEQWLAGAKARLEAAKTDRTSA